MLYEGLWRLHITPSPGKLALARITTPRLRKWRRELLDSGVGPVTVAEAYRLLRAVLNTAVADRLIGKNPCQIPGAGQEKSPKRPTATVEQVFTIADAMPKPYRLLVLLACFNSLRWGELVFGPPKSEASVRVVTIPSVILDDVKIHLKEYTKEGRTALLFAGATGLPIRRSNFQEHWTPAIEAAGIPHLHFHDLRHTGNTFAAESGATFRDLMDRMGHSTTRAALIYIHKPAAATRRSRTP